jgi:hypothetical protein
MICSSCGGSVTWCGPMSDLTHTECAGCGAHNNQIADQPDDEETEDDCDNSASVACNQYLIKSYRGRYK